MKKLKYFIPSFIVMIFIFYMSSRNGSTSSSMSGSIVNDTINVFNLSPSVYHTLEVIIRKLGHLSEFTLLFITLYYGFYKVELDNYFYPFIIGVLYACSDEIHQLFIIGRSGQVLDVFIDSIGLGIGLLIILLVKKIHRR